MICHWKESCCLLRSPSCISTFKQANSIRHWNILQLPAGLRSLLLARDFTQPIGAWLLPASLTHLSVGARFEQQLPPLLHTALESLDLSQCEVWSQSCAEWRFSPSLHTFVAPPILRVDSSLNDLFASSSLTHLDVSHCQSDAQSSAHDALLHVQWPPQLRKLTFGKWWWPSLSIGDWIPPASLVELQLPFSTETSFAELLLPSALQVLRLGKQSLRALHLPLTLRELHLGAKWNLSIAALPLLPLQLQLLAFGREFNQPVQGLQLPPSLHTLCFRENFNQPAQRSLPSIHIACVCFPFVCCSFNFIRLQPLEFGAALASRPIEGVRSASIVAQSACV